MVRGAEQTREKGTKRDRTRMWVQRAVSSFRNRMTEATVDVSLSDVYGNFTRMVQALDFTTIRRAHKEYCDNARTGPMLESTLQKKVVS